MKAENQYGIWRMVWELRRHWRAWTSVTAWGERAGKSEPGGYQRRGKRWRWPADTGRVRWAGIETAQLIHLADLPSLLSSTLFSPLPLPATFYPFFSCLHCFLPLLFSFLITISLIFSPCFFPSLFPSLHLSFPSIHPSIQPSLPLPLPTDFPFCIFFLLLFILFSLWIEN